MVVLDTDHVSLYERASGQEARRLRARIERLPAQDWAATIISFEEQMRGWLAYLARARRLAAQVEAYRRLSKHLDNYRPLRVLEFDETAATEFQRLQKNRLRLGTMDLRIAAIVLAQDATLLTRNLADFRKVPNLRIEDWTT